MRCAASLALLGSLALTACVFVHAEDRGHRGRGRSESRSRRDVVTATLEGKSGSKLSGSAVCTAMEGGVLIEVRVEDTAPGWHAVHIHENGDCSSPDGKSAGGHFNPEGVAHGAPHAQERHAGDLGNMWVDDEGHGFHSLFMPHLTLSKGPLAVRGRAIIIHAGADDLTSQPTGAAGGRIGCGVLR